MLRVKERFFAQFGFSPTAWETLAAALIQHAADHEVAMVEASPFGARYVIEGTIRAPDGRTGSAVCDRVSVGKEVAIMHELDRVVLTTDLTDYGLKDGDIGTVVLIHRGGEGYEVEFVTLDGETIAVISLPPSQIRPIGQREIAHARGVG